MKQETTTPQPNKKKKKKRVIWTILIVFLVSFLAGMTVFGVYIAQGLPSLEELENPEPQLASRVYSSNGELIFKYYIENRIESDIDSLPKHLINALIATEDRKFYDHWGVDVDRILKIVVKNIIMFKREGASTLTQQLAKNLYKLKIENESIFDTFVRKFREWITAIQIEKTFTKDEILEMYLNVSFFGKNAYGVEAAAKRYFNKTASELTIPESAMLVALLKSHVNYDPTRRYERALQRRNLVMYNMYDAGFISRAEYEQYSKEPITLAKDIKYHTPRSEAPHYVEYVRQQMNDMAETYGYDLYRDGLSIYTTIDMDMQRIANTMCAKHLEEFQETHNQNWNWNRHQDVLNTLVDQAARRSDRYKVAESTEEKQRILTLLKNDQAFIDSIKEEANTVQIGFVAIDPHMGHILAMVGGENQEFAYGLNHVTQIRRQPGSSFKPFVYTVALDNGYYPAFSLLNQRFDIDGWSPKNSSSDYGGYMTLRRGLAGSVNIIAGRLTGFGYAPPATVVEYAHRMGIQSELQPYPAIALGVFEVSPLEITSAYGTFANNGVHVDPISILRIEDKNGMVIAEFRPAQRVAISEQTAGLMVNMMQDVVNAGTGAGVRRYFHKPAAGKTGTTQDYGDAWFVGYTPHLVAGVWVGFDTRMVSFTGWYGQGARAALPAWGMFMAKVYEEKEYPLEYFKIPPGVVQVDFCKESIMRGDSRLANEYCPEIVSDYVMNKNMPLKCDIHDEHFHNQTDHSGDTYW